MNTCSATSSLRYLNRSANLVVLPISVMVLFSSVGATLPLLTTNQSSSVPWFLLGAVMLLGLKAFVDGAQSAFHARQYLSARSSADNTSARNARIKAAWWGWWLRRSLIAMGFVMVGCCGYGHLYSERIMNLWVISGVFMIAIFAYGTSAWFCWEGFHQYLTVVLDPP